MAESRFQRWVARRIPPARQLTLDQRRIFIFPTAMGFGFLAMLALMLLAAINYQNNLAFALVFFLFSLMLVAILHTFSNLSGLTLEGLRGHPTFAGESAEFELRLSRAPRRRHIAIELAWPGEGEATVSLEDAEALTLKLFHHAARRGWLRPPRLRVQSSYPLGLLRAWSWLDLDLAALVYPRPLPGPQPESAGEGQPHGEQRLRPGSEDFHGFRDYRPGDNLRHVMWRAWARGQPLQSKQFAELQTKSHWLRWEAVSGEREQRLGLLCHWVLELHRRGEAWALALPGDTIPLGSGEAQRQRCLQALALFGQPSTPPRPERERRG